MIEEPGRAWEDCEAALDDQGTPLPLYHRAVWARATNISGTRCSFVPIREPGGRCRAGFSFESQPTRALPGHRLLSVRRFGVRGGGMDEQAFDAGVAGLVAHARNDRSVLRVTVDAYAPEEDSLRRTCETLARNGFHQVETTRTYERTLLIDLTPSEETILAGFSRSARRNIRSLEKFPVAITSAASTALAPRLQQIDAQTRSRTDGGQRKLDWRAYIEMSATAPRLSRIAILRRTDREGDGALLAFAWGCMHGDVVEYSESGSVRTDDLKIPTSYALLWDLVRWARRNGAKAMDMGGVTIGTERSEDRLGGISDFKRHFSQKEISVGQQWQFEPHPGRAVVARAVSRGARILRGALTLRNDS